jgi:hypothetical protein
VVDDEHLADLRAQLLGMREELVAQLVVQIDTSFLHLLASVHGSIAAD